MKAFVHVTLYIYTGPAALWKMANSCVLTWTAWFSMLSLKVFWLPLHIRLLLFPFDVPLLLEQLFSVKENKTKQNYSTSSYLAVLTALSLIFRSEAPIWKLDEEFYPVFDC